MIVVFFVSSPVWCLMRGLKSTFLVAYMVFLIFSCNRAV